MIGQLLDGRYRIVQVLSGGAFGQTYLAADTRRPGHPQCVVKQLRPPGNSKTFLKTAHRLFKQEAEILEKLGRHEQIPLLLAYFQEDNQFYLVEEFVPGNPLHKEIIPGHPWSEEQVIRLLSEILEILIFVHSQGVIHRDVNPSNLIRRKSDGKLVLIDFGSVKEVRTLIANVNGEMPRTIATGTPSYMPVEQFQGNPQFNSDIYAVGIIGIQALTGLPSSELPKLQDTKPSGTGSIIWRNRSRCSGVLADIVDKMVAHHFAKRYQSAEQTLVALRKLQRRKVSLPVPKSPNYKNKHKGLKKWQSLLLLSFAAVGFLAVLVGLLNFFNRPAPERAEAYYVGATEMSKKGELQGALAAFNKSIELNPSKAEAFYGRGNIYYQAGNYQQAIADYNKAIALNPSYTNAYFNRGLARYNQEDYSGAIDDYSKVLGFEPKDAEAYYQRALSYYQLQDYSKAIEDYTNTLQLQPEDTKAYKARGLAKTAAGDLQDALTDYTKAIALEPDNADAYYNRGRTRFFLGDYQGARDDYTKTIELERENQEAYANRCSTYINLANYEGAVQDCTRALTLEQNDADSYNNRCVAYFNMDDYEEAIADCTKAIEIDGQYHQAYSNRGLVHQEAGKLEAAIEDYTQAIALNPNNPEAYANRAKTYYLQHDYEKALADYVQATRLNPNYAAAYYGRGMVREALGDKTGAINDFETAGTLYLEQGRSGGYKDAKYQIERLSVSETKNKNGE